MASVCFYFQLHQPERLRRYSVFDADLQYFDHERNDHILDRVAEKCYVPATELLLEVIKSHDGKFRCSFSVTGLLIEQLQARCPKAIELLQRLADTGCVEFLSETYYHSLAFLYSRDEFRAQVDAHTAMIERLFKQTPRVFRNTELIYNNDLAHYLTTWDRFHGILAEGARHLLGERSANVLYHPPGLPKTKLLLRNYMLSDDIAFRFSNRDWALWPLKAEQFASWIGQIDNGPDAAGGKAPQGMDTAAWRQRIAKGNVCNLFVDFETFGEHQWEDSGVFDFLRALPAKVLEHNGIDFKTASECIQAYDAADEFDAPHMISWADTERDLSAWLGNAMQSNALHELFKLEQKIKSKGDAALVEDWRKLTCSDHFYYMCTKYFADGQVHKYFNPYESPYDSYINFMNVLDNLRTRLEDGTGKAL